MKTVIYHLNSIRKIESDFVDLQELQRAFKEEKESINAVDYNGNKLPKKIYLEDIQDMETYN